MSLDRFTIKPKFINASDDPEKSVTPVVVYRYQKLEESPEIRGVALLIGWWHFGVGIHIMWRKKESEQFRSV